MDATVVKDLRDKTGAGMMDCKKALMEANGNLEEAVQILRKKGIAKAAKKADRAVNEGQIGSWVSADLKKGALIEINCETDFVARNEGFQKLLAQVLQEVAKADAKSFANGLLEDAAVIAKINTIVAEAIATLGENVSFRRALRYDATAGRVASYIHLGAKLGVLVELEGQAPKADDIAKDLCLHIAAAAPQYFHRSEVPQDILDKEKDVVMAQMVGKPAQMIEKIVAGKLEKFYSDVCVLEQPFVKDPSKKVKDTLDGLTLKRFTRFQLGA